MNRDEDLSPKQLYDRNRYRRLRAARDAARPPDPIALLDAPTVAYLAGLTDADGSIFVTHTNRLRTYYPVVTWAMTHRPTIDWVAGLLKGRSVVLNNHTSWRGRVGWETAKFRDQWRTQVAGARAKLLCERMLPYMHTKAEQARLVLAFPVDERRAPGLHLSDEVRAERERLGALISGLNRG
jgi:hypothetical protein